MYSNRAVRSLRYRHTHVLCAGIACPRLPRPDHIIDLRLFKYGSMDSASMPDRRRMRQWRMRHNNYHYDDYDDNDDDNHDDYA